MKQNQKLIILILSGLLLVAAVLFGVYLYKAGQKEKLEFQKQKQKFEQKTQIAEKQTIFSNHLTSFNCNPEFAIEEILQQITNLKPFLNKGYSFVKFYPVIKGFTYTAKFHDQGSIYHTYSGNLLFDTICGIYLGSKIILPKNREVKNPLRPSYILGFKLKDFKEYWEYSELKPILYKYPLTVQAISKSGHYFLVLNYEDFIENYNPGDKFRVLDKPKIMVFFETEPEEKFYVYNKDHKALWTTRFKLKKQAQKY